MKSFWFGVVVSRTLYRKLAHMACTLAREPTTVIVRERSLISIKIMLLRIDKIAEKPLSFSCFH